MLDFLRLNSIEKRGILGLIILVFLLFGYQVWQRYNTKPVDFSPLDSEEVVTVQRFIDSLKEKEEEKKNRERLAIYPFNPNFLTDYRGYQLGMSTEEIDRLLSYRKQELWVNSAAEFQEVTEISDSLLNRIAPYFQFPEWTQNRRGHSSDNRSSPANQKLSTEQKKDLNKVSVDELQEIAGIGPALSKRIVRYRAQLGGFVADLQLKDIYGLKYDVRENILRKYTVKSNRITHKIALNSATIEELLTIYYIDYELARRIINYRITHEGFEDLEELTRIEGFPIDKMDRIQLFMTL